MTETGRSQILIADDDAITRLVLRKILAAESTWQVVEANSGSSAWRLLEGGLQPDLCLLDVNMPELDGLGLLRKIRESATHKGMGAILCTAAHDRSTIVQAAGLGVDYYVLKPFQKELVLSQIRQVLAKIRKSVPPPVVERAQTNLSAFVQPFDKLPSLPSIHQDFTYALGRPDSSISIVCNHICQDQSLVARLLKLANSVFYGSTEVTTVEAAVQLVGLEQLQDLAAGTAALWKFDNACDQLVTAKSLWKHSLACAVASVWLGEFRRDPVPERLYIGGLLHDIGRLVMFLQAPDEAVKIHERCQREGQIPIRVEREILGFDHAMIGAELLAQWNVPKAFVDMVAYHHAPTKSSKAGPSDSFLIHYADYITSSLQFGDSGEAFVPPLLVTSPVELTFIESLPVEALVAHLESRCEGLATLGAEAEK